MKKVWYITGASKGLGLSLVKFLLGQGHAVAATSRHERQLREAVGSSYGRSFLPLEVNLTDEDAICKSLVDTNKHFGRLDVVVNNAGYGIGGTIEELSTKEIQDSLNINFLATLQVIRHVLPYFREQRNGYIINISSIAGFSGTMGWSLYTAEKAAVIGLTEGLAQDVRELGIRATAIAPGAFRTAFLTDDSLVIAAKHIADYQGVHKNHQCYSQMDGSQIGDPKKAAQVIVALAEEADPPVVLFLGSDAYRRAQRKMEEQQMDLVKFQKISYSTDY